jgi:hypothetical protein
MIHEEIKKLIDEYYDEDLFIAVDSKIQKHIAECEECREYFFGLQELKKNIENLENRLLPPNDLWPDISASVNEAKEEKVKKKEEISEIISEVLQEQAEDQKSRGRKSDSVKKPDSDLQQSAVNKKLKNRKITVTVISVLILAAAFILYYFFNANREAWEISKQQFGSDSYSNPYAEMKEQDVIETNQVTKLQIQIPKIGKIYIEPESKIQRLSANNIRVMAGTINLETTSEKGELFFEVPGAEIKEYKPGGSYTITLSDSGKSVVDVSKGWLMISGNNVEAFVLQNNLCTVIADSGVGLPYQKNSSEEFVNLIDEYCFTSNGDEVVLISILTKANARNAITLWNLLKRVNPVQRTMVVNTIFGLLGEVPAGITRDGLKVLDKEMVVKLLEYIESLN